MAETDIDPANNVTLVGPAAPPGSDVDPAQNTRSPLSTSYDRLPRDGDKGIVRNFYSGTPFQPALSGEVGGGNIPGVRDAFREGYEGTASPSVNRAGVRSMWAPEFQRELNEKGWWGSALNFGGEMAGTLAADIAGAGNVPFKLGVEALKSVLPEKAVNDIVVAGQVAPAHIASPGMVMPRKVFNEVRNVNNAVRELSTPPPTSLSELLQRQRAAPSTDPTINDAISILRRATNPTGVPPPPTPFTPSAQSPMGPRQPSPTVAPSGGLLNIPERSLPGVAAPQLTEAEMRAIRRGYYSPADEAAARGAMIPTDHTDSMLGILTDAVPTDPHMIIAKGNTPLIQLGKEYAPLKGQPMSYDAAMTLDKRLTTERQAAMKSGDGTLANEIEDAQDKIRAKMDSVPEDGTGDPQALANVKRARQAYHQERKESQLNDIRYDASLLPEDKQNAYIKNRATAMLRNDRKMSGWDADERAALEEAVKSGNIGSLKSAGISAIKPLMRGAGGFGGSVFGVPGAIVGSEIGGEMGAGIQAKIRDALTKIDIDAVSKQLSQRVPPPPGQ